ncbi:Aspartic proteinase nepenthesin-1, partial [Bienertia sinuspersici]
RVLKLGPTNLITRPSLGFNVQNYYVQVGIGTFGQFPRFDTVYLGIDTGSDLTWTQCEGCRKCFYQVDPYFSPSRSISYKLFPCQQCPSPCQHEDICRLTRNYGDGSRLRADAATETFHFQSVDNKFDNKCELKFETHKYPPPPPTTAPTTAHHHHPHHPPPPTTNRKI